MGTKFLRRASLSETMKAPSELLLYSQDISFPSILTEDQSGFERGVTRIHTECGCLWDGPADSPYHPADSGTCRFVQKIVFLKSEFPGRLRNCPTLPTSQGQILPQLNLKNKFEKPNYNRKNAENMWPAHVLAVTCPPGNQTSNGPAFRMLKKRSFISVTMNRTWWPQK